MEKIVRAMPPATSATVLPVDTAVEAMAELLLVTSLVMVLPRLLTVVGLRRSGPVISQCLTWGTRLLISLPSCGAWLAARITTTVMRPPTRRIAARTVVTVASHRDSPIRRNRARKGCSSAVARTETMNGMITSDSFDRRWMTKYPTVPMTRILQA